MGGVRVNRAGFTVIEAVMAMGALAIVLLGIYQLPGMFANQEKRLENVVTKDRIFKSFAQKFIQVAERADVALRFEYLPVPAACIVGSNSCLRKLVDGKSFEPTTVTGIASSLQFFSDTDGQLVESKPFPNDASFSHVRIQTAAPLVLDDSVKRGENYVTWTLERPQSQPFPLLTRSSLNDYFFLVDQFALSSSSSHWVIVEGIRPGVPTDQLLKKPMVVYNANDFSQYAIEKVVAAIDCTTTDVATKQKCTVAAQSIVPTFVPDPTFFSSRKVYAIELEDFSATDLGGFLPPTGVVPSSWGNQNAQIYLFPTTVLSLTTHQPTAAGGSDLLHEPADPKRFAHFQHMLAPTQQGRLALLPVELVNYRLVDVLDAKGVRTGKMTLEMGTLGTNHSVHVLEDVLDGAKIVFARRIGTTELGVFQLE
jgi:hypothetical protein